MSIDSSQRDRMTPQPTATRIRLSRIRRRSQQSCPNGQQQSTTTVGRRTGNKSLRRVTTMLFIVTVIFVVCWTPYHVMNFVAVHNYRHLVSHPSLISQLRAAAAAGLLTTILSTYSRRDTAAHHTLNKQQNTRQNTSNTF